MCIFFLVSACKLPLLTEDIIVFPLQAAYHLGETVFLSCPEGKELQGEKSSTCDSSLHFSPDPAEVRCIQGIVSFLLCKDIHRWPWVPVKQGMIAQYELLFNSFLSGIVPFQQAAHMISLSLSHS